MKQWICKYCLYDVPSEKNANIRMFRFCFLNFLIFLCPLFCFIWGKEKTVFSGKKGRNLEWLYWAQVLFKFTQTAYFSRKVLCLQCHTFHMIFYMLWSRSSPAATAGRSWFRAWSLKQSLYFLPGRTSRMEEPPGKTHQAATSLFSFVSLLKTLLCYDFSVTLQSN